MQEMIKSLSYTKSVSFIFYASKEFIVCQNKETEYHPSWNSSY